MMFSSPRRLVVLTLALAIPLILAALWLSSVQIPEYTVYVGDKPIKVKGHFTTISDLLGASGLIVGPEDIVIPDRDQIPHPEFAISVLHAQEVIIEFSSGSMLPQIAEDISETRHSHQDNLASFLFESGILLQQGDQVFADGQMIGEGQLANSPLPAQLKIVRPNIEAVIREGEEESTVTTAAATVGELLLEEGIRLNADDFIDPPLSSWLGQGTQIELIRSLPVTVTVDGQVVHTRSHHHDVRSILTELGVTLSDQDYTLPGLDASVKAHDQINVFRVREEYEVSEETIPFLSTTQPTNNIEIDNVAVIQQGLPGIVQRRTLVRYENGVETSRVDAGESVAQEPINEVVGYGTNIVIRSLDTPQGPIEYWRVVNMRVTAYTAATSGKEPSHPAYGITASGVPAGFGVVAVDPNIVPFRSYVYVPGYGKGFAGDTGGGVKGRFIDLGYDDGQIVAWNGYVDVYYLTPVPAPEQINYILPSSLP